MPIIDILKPQGRVLSRNMPRRASSRWLTKCAGTTIRPSRSLHAAGRRKRFETVGQFALGLALRRSERRQGLHRIAGRVYGRLQHGRFDHPRPRPARLLIRYLEAQGRRNNRAT